MPSSFSKDPVHEPVSIDEAKEQKIYLDFLYKQPPFNSPPLSGVAASILFHADIVDREFGNALLSVSGLKDWISSKGLHLVTKPSINDFEFVQVEALLCAVERAATDGLTQPTAKSFVKVSKTLADDPAADIAAQWLIGADAHQQWREVIRNAVLHNELALLDWGSKLPINGLPAQTGTTSATVGAVGASGGVETDKAVPAKPLQRTAAQDSAILCEIKKLGFNPMSLAKNPSGKPGVKAAVRAALLQSPLFTGRTVFDKAWERLTAHADIAIQD